MKLLKAEQIRAVDNYTMQHEPIASLALMERAAMACVKRLVKLVELDDHVVVVCGKGNNGGDGLAIARLMLNLGYNCSAWVVHYTEKFSPDAHHNYHVLKEKHPTRVQDISSVSGLGERLCGERQVAVDALLGTGINKAPEGLLAEVIGFINHHFGYIISVDVPSGLFTDVSSRHHAAIVRSSLTLSFQAPKLAFLLPENSDYVGEFEILDIGLHQKGLAMQESNNYYITRELVRSLLKPRVKFSHKGAYGHALLLAGSKGKGGAAVISARAAMRSGAGLLSVHSTGDTVKALLNHLPEAMGIEDDNTDYITGVAKPEHYSAIAFGPGTGLFTETQQALKKLLQYYAGKLLIDADGLNILSENKTWLSFLPPSCILTPHPKEFERLCGKFDNDFERMEGLRQFSIKHNCLVLLKGAHSALAMPDGNLFFNSSGNAGLAKAGSGDGLTGIILGLLSRGYTSPQAAIIGMFMHGYAADLCVKRKSKESLLITDVIEQLPKAFKKMEN